MSELDRRRRHREEMQLALREGLTLDAARARLFELRERARRHVAEPRRAPPPRAPIADGPDSPFWWKRED